MAKPEKTGYQVVCAERPAHPVSPPLSTRRLAGVHYQLDLSLVQAGIVNNGRHQEDPVVRSLINVFLCMNEN